MMANGQHILERAGTQIHYWLSGTAGRPLIVFTHGATLDHRSFEPQLAVLERDYRILTWDVRGHGLSQPIGHDFSISNCVEDLLAILDQIGVRQAIFVGLSMGGNITQELIFLHPERVTAAVLMDCACNTLELGMLERWLVKLSVPMLRMYPSSMLRRQIVNQSSIKPDVRTYIQDACSKVLSGQDFMTIWAEVTNCLHSEPGYHIPLPLLLMRGDQDRLGNFKTAMPHWAQRDHAQYIVIPDAGHTSNQDNPQAVNQALLAFLHQHVPETTTG